MKTAIKAYSGKVDLTEYTTISGRHAREFLSSTFTPIDFEEDITLRDDVFLTKGCAYLRYAHHKSHKGFVIECYDHPLYLMRLTHLRDYDDFLKECEVDWRFDFIRRVTNICEEHFELAAYNYGIFIPLNFDFIKYRKECGGTTRFTTRAALEQAIADVDMIRERKKQSKIVRNRKPKEASK